MTTKRIVITGSSGFLGQHLLQSLLTKGPLQENVRYEILALYGSGEQFASSVISKCRPSPQVTVTFDRLDLTNQDAVQQWAASSNNKAIDVCLHLAAMASPAKCQEEPNVAHAVNCPTAFFRVLADAEAAVVAMSTDQVYNGRKAPYDETTGKADPVNIYGKTKVAMEDSLKDIFPDKFVALRSSIIAGPEAPFGNAHGTFLHFCKSRQNMFTDYYTDECRSVIAVSDVVSILTHFVEQGIINSGIYNMGGRDGVSRHDMAMAVADLFQHDTKYIVARTKAQQQNPSVPSPLDISMDSTKLEQVVGFSFKTFSEIVKETFPDTATTTK